MEGVNIGAILENGIHYTLVSRSPTSIPLEFTGLSKNFIAIGRNLWLSMRAFWPVSEDGGRGWGSVSPGTLEFSNVV